MCQSFMVAMKCQKYPISLATEQMSQHMRAQGSMLKFPCFVFLE